MNNPPKTQQSKKIKSTVKLEKANPKGWFLTIGDDMVNKRWAVTSEELYRVWKEILHNFIKIREELGEESKS